MHPILNKTRSRQSRSSGTTRWGSSIGLITILTALTPPPAQAATPLMAATQPVEMSTSTRLEPASSLQQKLERARLAYMQALADGRCRILTSSAFKVAEAELRDDEADLADARLRGQDSHLADAAQNCLNSKAHLAGLLAGLDGDPEIRSARDLRDSLDREFRATVPSMNLLDVLQLPRDEVAGRWVQQPDGLCCTSRKGWPRICVPISISGSYELEIKFKRSTGDDYALGVVFPAGDTDLALVLGGWGGATSGLEAIDGNGASENASTFHGDIQRQQEHTCSISVTPMGSDLDVRVDLDELPIISWRGSQQSAAIFPQWKLKEPHTIGLSIGGGTDTIIHTFTCYPISGSISLSRSPSDVAQSDTPSSKVPSPPPVNGSIEGVGLSMPGQHADERSLEQQARLWTQEKSQTVDALELYNLQRHAIVDARDQLNVEERLERESNSSSPPDRFIQEDERRLDEVKRDSQRTDEAIRRLEMRSLEERLQQQ